MALLELHEVRRTYGRGRNGEVVALAGVTLTLEGGEFVAIQGPSGCGKTTLLLTAGGLLSPDSGRVTVAGEDSYRLSHEARAAFRARTVGFVFQQFHLVPYLTVLDNVLAPVLAAPSRAQPRRRAEELLKRFNLEHRRHHVPAELSTGERQRVALARALLNQPKVLLADEPTGNLDIENASIILQDLVEFARAGGAVLLVTHEATAARHAHRVVQMSAGRLLAGQA